MSKKSSTASLPREQTLRFIQSLAEAGEDFEMRNFGNVSSIRYDDTPANKKRLDSATASQAPDMEVPLSNRLHKLVLTHAIQDKVGDPQKKSIEEDVEEVLLRYRQRIKELEGPFEKITKLASDLAADLEWARKMWAYDRTSLLENSKYWKSVTETLVEQRILDRASGKEKYADSASLAKMREMTRPSWRAVVRNT